MHTSDHPMHARIGRNFRCLRNGGAPEGGVGGRSAPHQGPGIAVAPDNRAIRAWILSDSLSSSRRAPGFAISPQERHVNAHSSAHSSAFASLAQPLLTCRQHGRPPPRLASPPRSYASRRLPLRSPAPLGGGRAGASRAPLERRHRQSELTPGRRDAAGENESAPSARRFVDLAVTRGRCRSHVDVARRTAARIT